MFMRPRLCYAAAGGNPPLLPSRFQPKTSSATRGNQLLRQPRITLESRLVDVAGTVSYWAQHTEAHTCPTPNLWTSMLRALNLRAVSPDAALEFLAVPRLPTEDRNAARRGGRKRGRSEGAAPRGARSTPIFTSSAPPVTSVGGAPWRRARGGAFSSLPSRAPLLRLHEEILDFASFVAPTPAEQAAADGAIERIRDVIADVFPDGRMEIFGSRANGLVLPTSDWDVVLFGVHGDRRNMHRLGAEIEARGLVASMEVIDSARVPIIKLRERQSGISVDISFESSAASGIVTRGLITDFVRRCVLLASVLMCVR